MRIRFVFLLIFSAFPIFAAPRSSKAAGSAELFTAVETASAKEVKKLLNSVSELPVRAGNETLLMAAVKANRDIDVVNEILEIDDKVTRTNESGVTALMFACQYESHEKVITTIISSSAILKTGRKNYILKADTEGCTAFDYARKNENPLFVLNILEKYAPAPEGTDASLQPDAPEGTDVSPQPAAPEREPAATAESAAAEPAATTTGPLSTAAGTAKGEAAPTNAAAATTKAATTKAAPALNAQPETAAAPSGQKAAGGQEEKAPASSPLAPAVVETYTPTYLLDYAELDTVSAPEPSAPADLGGFRHTFIPNADEKDSEGRTLLMKAVRDGNEELIEDLLYSEADIHAQDKDGWTVLMFAARFQQDPQIIRRLRALGADVTKTNKYGLSALALAAGLSDSPAVVEALLEGRSVAEKDVRASFIYAITMEAATDILTLFLEKGISINAPYNAMTPLMYAAENNTGTTTIAWLLRHGAKTNYKTSSGKTAFDFAQANSRLPHNETYWALNATKGGN